MRTAGLEQGGEFSVENLAYKTLRNAGVLDKLRLAMLHYRDWETFSWEL